MATSKFRQILDILWIVGGPILIVLGFAYWAYDHTICQNSCKPYKANYSHGDCYCDKSQELQKP